MNEPLRRALPPVALVLLAAAGTFALTMGARQSMGLFLGNLNTATGLGLATSAWPSPSASSGGAWPQPFAGMVADRIVPAAC